MTTPLATATIEPVEGQPLVLVRLVGEIDISNEKTLEHQLVTSTHGPQGIVVDLSSLSYLDSAGVRMLQNVGRHALERRQVLHLVAPEPSTVRRLLTITELTKVLPVHDGVDEAIDACGREARSGEDCS